MNLSLIVGVYVPTWYIVPKKYLYSGTAQQQQYFLQQTAAYNNDWLPRGWGGGGHNGRRETAADGEGRRRQTR